MRFFKKKELSRPIPEKYRTLIHTWSGKYNNNQPVSGRWEQRLESLDSMDRLLAEYLDAYTHRPWSHLSVMSKAEKIVVTFSGDGRSEYELGWEEGHTHEFI